MKLIHTDYGRYKISDDKDFKKLTRYLNNNMLLSEKINNIRSLIYFDKIIPNESYIECVYKNNFIKIIEIDINIIYNFINEYNRICKLKKVLNETI